MILMQGTGVSRGVAKGKVHFVRRTGKAAEKSGAGVEAETMRFRQAQQQTVRQLRELAVRGRETAGEEAAALFETHAMFVEDEEYEDCILGMIRNENCSAGYAVQAVGERFAGRFAAMDDSYMQARAADVRDVSDRMAANLAGDGEAMEPDEPVILAGDDLTPSETIRLDRRKILGIVMRSGSAESHTAILARAMGIPAVCGVGEALKQEYAGRMVYMDGEAGQAVLEPDEPTKAALEEKYRKQREMKRRTEAMVGLEDITPDGRRIDICCNIGSPDDVADVLANDGRGIGLFRSEFLYMAGKDYPGEEEQFRAYRAAAEAMAGKRVVIRTLDLGADKQADYLNLKKEENPALGMRAIRISLNRPEVFRTQLRALYRASAYGRIAIMFPLITSVWEVRECRRICRQVVAELEAEGVACNRDAEVGIMIETPAAVMIADELAKEADFFSVGTNDLTQYMLACDRQGADMGRFFEPRHPSVLRALKMAAEAAHAAGIWIGVCGELAADEEMLPEFLAMGIDELSVSPTQVLPLRMAVRNCRAEREMKE